MVVDNWKVGVNDQQTWWFKQENMDVHRPKLVFYHQNWGISNQLFFIIHPKLHDSVLFTKPTTILLWVQQFWPTPTSPTSETSANKWHGVFELPREVPGAMQKHWIESCNPGAHSGLWLNAGTKKPFLFMIHDVIPEHLLQSSSFCYLHIQSCLSLKPFWPCKTATQYSDSRCKANIASDSPSQRTLVKGQPPREWKKQMRLVTVAFNVDETKLLAAAHELELHPSLIC